MKVRISKVVLEDIELSPSEVDEITIDRLKQLVAPGEYLSWNDGVPTLERDDPDWRHGSVQSIKVRDATHQDVIVFEIIRLIRNAD